MTYSPHPYLEVASCIILSNKLEVGVYHNDEIREIR